MTTTYRSIRTSVRLDTAALRGFGGKFANLSRSIDTVRGPLGPAYQTASEILTGDVRETILAGYTSSSPAVVRTGALARSFRGFARDGKNRVVIGSESDLIYARIQDQGGRIWPKTRKALAVPNIRVPIGKWPRHWGKKELFFIKGKSTKANTVGVLVRKLGKGKRQRLQAVYTLKAYVDIAPKHYLEKATATAKPKIVRFLGSRMMEAIRRG